MALKVLMLRKQLGDKKAELEKLRARSAEFELREAELEKDIEEAGTDEEKAAVEAAIEAFEKDNADHQAAQAELEREVDGLENELAEIEQAAPVAPAPENVRKVENDRMMTRKKFFGMDAQSRDAFLAREDVKEFLQRTRTLGSQKRAVNNGNLLIPTVVLDLIRDRVNDYSKLIKHVNLQQVPGKARQAVMGVIPEAVWTEMCASVNELDLVFPGVEVDGYKVGGYIPVCNAVLEDSDVDLAQAIIEALGKAIGQALDKAILYGTGTKMPMGIITRLAQTADPGDTSSTIPWTDLHESHVVAITGKTDTALIKAMVEAAGKAEGNCSDGNRFWAMSATTHARIIANSLSVNAAGAIVSGMNNTMPGVGGTIEELAFMPNGVIIGGYGDLYLLAERAGASIDESKHARFIDDQTVFKGTARYDGKPVVAEGFVAIGIDGTAPTAGAVTFAADSAN